MADIPVLFSKTKLKSLNFATNLTSIFKNFEEDAIIVPKPPSLNNNAFMGCQSREKKRSREEISDDEQIPSKAKKIDARPDKKSQKSNKFAL